MDMKNFILTANFLVLTLRLGTTREKMFSSGLWKQQTALVQIHEISSAIITMETEAAVRKTLQRTLQDFWHSFLRFSALACTCQCREIIVIYTCILSKQVRELENDTLRCYIEICNIFIYRYFTEELRKREGFRLVIPKVCTNFPVTNRPVVCWYHIWPSYRLTFWARTTANVYIPGFGTWHAERSPRPTCGISSGTRICIRRKTSETYRFVSKKELFVKLLWPLNIFKWIWNK